MKIYAASKLMKPLGYLHFSYLSAQERPAESIYGITSNAAQDLNEALAHNTVQMAGILEGIKTSFQHSLIALIVPAIIFPLGLFYLSLTNWGKKKKIIVSTGLAIAILTYYVGLLGFASSRLDLIKTPDEIKINTQERTNSSPDNQLDGPAPSRDSG